MKLKSPNNDEVVLVEQPQTTSALSRDNLIVFDESNSNPFDPNNIGPLVDNGINLSDYVFFAKGNGDGTYPNPEGLVKFKGERAEGEWTFEVADNKPGDIGLIDLVELEITCGEPGPPPVLPLPLVGFIPSTSSGTGECETSVTSAPYTIPVEGECSIIQNVVVSFAIEFDVVGALTITLKGPDGTVVI